MQGTPGASFHSALNVATIDAVFRKGSDPTVDSYSGFFDNDRRADTGLADWLRSASVDRVDVLGLATDYCVRFTALDAAQLGLETRVLLAGCRGVGLAEGDIERAMEEMRSAGIAVLD